MALRLCSRRWTNHRSSSTLFSSACQIACISTRSSKSSERIQLPDELFRPSTENITKDTFWKEGVNPGDDPIQKAHALKLLWTQPMNEHELQVQRRLSLPTSNPSKILSDCIAGGVASLNVVRLCLESQFQEVSNARRRERRNVAEAQDPIAAIALAHLMSDVKLWGAAAKLADSVMFHLCYFALVDGLGDEVFFNWISIPTPSPSEQSAAWRSSIMRFLVAAHSFYDRENNKDNAIRCFLGVHSIQQRARMEYEAKLARDETTRKPDILYLSLFPAWIELVNILVSVDTSYPQKTSPKLYDRLLNVARSFPKEVRKGKANELEYDIAQMLLMHPGRPQDTNAVRMLRDFAAGNLEAFPSIITTPSGEKYFKRFLQRTTDVLSYNDNNEHREWVRRKFHVLIDPTTGNFATPTIVAGPDDEPHRPKQGRSWTKNTIEPVPFPTFT